MEDEELYKYPIIKRLPFYETILINYNCDLDSFEVYGDKYPSHVKSLIEEHLGNLKNDEKKAKYKSMKIPPSKKGIYLVRLDRDIDPELTFLKSPHTKNQEILENILLKVFYEFEP